MTSVGPIILPARGGGVELLYYLVNPMSRCRHPVAFTLALVCVLFAADTGWSADAACKAARKHFRDSIWWFESNQWEKAVELTNRALQALAESEDCTPKELRFVVPYGRWRYKFNPEVYLGVSLQKAERCEPEVEWSRQLADSQVTIERRTRSALRLVRPHQEHPSLLLPEECKELWSVVTLLQRAIPLKANSNRLACEQLSRELAEVL